MPEPAGSADPAGRAGRAAATVERPTASRRAGAVEPFRVMELVAAASALERSGDGPTVCHLEVGQPSAGLPAAVLAEAAAALTAPQGYTPALGTPELRAAISELYAARHGLHVDPDRVAVTTGASGGFLLAALALFDPGDRVAVVEPGYPCSRATLDLLGVTTVRVGVDATTGWLPTPDLLDAAGPLDGVVVASPANPTGATLDEPQLADLRAWCGRRGARLVADETYHGIVDGPPAPTAAAFGEAVVVQSCSKFLRMPGWRLGWLVLPPELVTTVDRLAQHLALAPPTPAQHVALAALARRRDFEDEVARYSHNRRLLAAAVEDAGIGTVAPAPGAFYLWVELAGGRGARAVCEEWLADLAVVATPGVDFDRVHGDRFVRCSVAGPTDEVEEAARRLLGWAARR
ncbi:MAG: pyridoxal phosphate-dependent aminotransferase [Microthrixaceae bacterium]